MPPTGDTASEDHAEVGDVHRSDTEAENNFTKSGKPNKKPIAEVDISTSSNMSQDHYTSHSDSTYSYLDMEATCPPTTRNIDHVYANMTRVNTSALLDEDVPMEEKLVAQLDMIQQQATMDKKQIREELFGMKNRIKWLEDRTLEQQVGPKETLSTLTSSQRHQRMFLQPLRRPRGGTFSYALRPLRGKGGHLDLRLDLVVDLLPHYGQGWTCGLVLVICRVV